MKRSASLPGETIFNTDGGNSTHYHIQDPDSISKDDIEKIFSRLSLSFKTDRLTLSERLNLSERQRDISETNMDKEIKICQNLIKDLSRVWSDSSVFCQLVLLQKQVALVQTSASKVSTSAETYGAVQQESRVGQMVEVLYRYAKDLRNLYEKTHEELLETKKILDDNDIVIKKEKVEEEQGKKCRSISLIYQPKTEEEAYFIRRASTGHNIRNGTESVISLKRIVKPGGDVPQRKPSHRLSMFDTITEYNDIEVTTETNNNSHEKLRVRKSSKKVSIKEEINRDYYPEESDECEEKEDLEKSENCDNSCDSKNNCHIKLVPVSYKSRLQELLLEWGWRIILFILDADHVTVVKLFLFILIFIILLLIWISLYF